VLRVVGYFVRNEEATGSIPVSSTMSVAISGILDLKNPVSCETGLPCLWVCEPELNYRSRVSTNTAIVRGGIVNVPVSRAKVAVFTTGSAPLDCTG